MHGTVQTTFADCDLSLLCPAHSFTVIPLLWSVTWAFWLLSNHHACSKQLVSTHVRVYLSRTRQPSERKRKDIPFSMEGAASVRERRIDKSWLPPWKNNMAEFSSVSLSSEHGPFHFFSVAIQLLSLTRLMKPNLWAIQALSVVRLLFLVSLWPYGQCARLRIEWSGFGSSPGTLCCILGQDTLLPRCFSQSR